MSFLMRPRAHFKGVFTANVPTANNDKVSMTLDEASVKAWNPQNLTDEEYRLWMMQTRNVQNPASVWLNSYFNYFGDSGMTFTSAGTSGSTNTTAMTSSILPDGTILMPEQDKFLLGKVSLLGDMFFDRPGTARMVDLDPIGIYGTQIFSGQFQVVFNTSDGPLIMLTAENPTDRKSVV